MATSKHYEMGAETERVMNSLQDPLNVWDNATVLRLALGLLKTAARTMRDDGTVTLIGKGDPVNCKLRVDD